MKNILLTALNGKYVKICKLIKHMDKDNILSVAGPNNISVNRIDGEDHYVSVFSNASFSSSSNKITKAADTITIYPETIIKICKEHKFDVVAYTALVYNAVCANIDKGLVPDLNVDAYAIDILGIK